MFLQHHIGDQRHLCIRLRVLTYVDWAVACEMCILFMNITFQGYVSFWKLKWFRIWKYELFLMYVCMFKLLLRYLCITQLVWEFAMYVCIYRVQNIFPRCPTPRLHCFLSSHWPSFRFLSFMAFFIPSIQFFFGLPRAPFCFGIHFNAILGSLSSAILWTCVNHKGINQKWYSRKK